MADTTTPQDSTDAPSADLPGFAGRAAEEQPALWAALQALGREASEAGPLDARTRRLVRLALAVGVGSEGATHSHSRRGLAEGLTPAELEHVAWLAVTTLGWPQAIRGLTWIRDETRPGETD
ncbi:MAG: carboxymuconolactone decarboxylase family protein [Pseudomonadota bacterium]|jgi:alkylhydroperoxidase/carboxymuconolactone decarboxylase family protein YurZ